MKFLLRETHKKAASLVRESEKVSVKINLKRSAGDVAVMLFSHCTHPHYVFLFRLAIY